MKKEDLVTQIGLSYVYLTIIWLFELTILFGWNFVKKRLKIRK